MGKSPLVLHKVWNFLSTMDSNLDPFNTDLIFGNKKSHMGLGQVNMVDIPTWWSCASSKTSWQTGHCVPAHCLGEEPMRRSSTFQVFFSPVPDSLSKPPCSDMVNGLTFRHPIYVNNPSDVEKKTIIALNLDLLCHTFFCLGELGLFQCMDWRLLSGSYCKNHDSSQVITFSKKFGSFSMFWRMSAKMFIQISFCSGVRSHSTIFEHTSFMLKLLCKICQTVSMSMLINSATDWMLRRWFCQTISPTFSMLVSVFDVLGWLGRWSYQISSLPSLTL